MTITPLTIVTPACTIKPHHGHCGYVSNQLTAANDLSRPYLRCPLEMSFHAQRLNASTEISYAFFS